MEGVDRPRVGLDGAGKGGGAVLEDVQVAVARADLSPASQVERVWAVVYSLKQIVGS